MWNALKFLVFFSQDRTGKVAPDSAPGTSTSRGSPLVDSTATPARRPSRNAGSASASRKTSPATSPTVSGWEESRLRDPEAPGRLVLVTATATLCLSLQGARVEAGGRRTEADPHWFRSLSYFRIGWNWIKRALEHGDPTVPTPRGHLGLRVSVMSFVSQPSKRGWDKSLPLGIVPALDSLVNRVDRTPRNTSNLSNTQEGDHQVLLTKKSIRIQGLF
jgi:hypothetical protein